MPTLTVFTPAYNRAHTIGRTYESLSRQTCRDFEWLIIDDGSTDGTRALVESWIQPHLVSRETEGSCFSGMCPAGFKISYFWQENQGMHGAHNTAYRHITTELNTCIDSDDWMPEDAVEKIVTFWKMHGDDKYAGVVGLDYTAKGELIGTMFPSDMTETTLSGFYAHGGKGDKKLVYRTEVITKYPEYPRFEGERYFSLGYKYLLVDQDYKLLTMNEPLVIVDYQQDGSSHSMFRQYWNNPQGFMFLRQEHMRYNHSFKSLMRSCIHYVSHCIRARQYRKLLSTPYPFTTFIAVPAGVCLYFYTRHQVQTGAKMKINQHQ